MKILKLVLLVCLFASELQTQVLPKVPEWQFGMIGNNVGGILMEVKDLNNDNINEIILSASEETDIWERQDYFYILEYNESVNTYEFKWTSRIFDEKINTINFWDLNNDTFEDIIIGLKDGNIHFFDGKSHTEVKSIRTNLQSINSLEILDLNNNSDVKIIVCDFNAITIYNLDLDIELELPFGAKYMQIGNIDEDNDHEILLSSGKMLKYVNGSYELEMEFPTYMNLKLFELSDIDNDNILELIYDKDEYVFACYDFQTQSHSWITTISSYPTILHCSENNISGNKELYIGTTYDGIFCYDISNCEFLWKTDDHHDGVNNLVIGDPDNDGEKEFIWADGGRNTGEDHIYIQTLPDLETEWTSYHIDGSFTTFDFGDVDNDGENEIVVASEASNSNFDGGVISVFDAETYDLEWQSEAMYGDITSIKIADTDNNNINELLFGTGSLAKVFGYLFIYNTANYEQDTVIHIWDSRHIVNIEIADINQDAKNEIILGSGSGWGDDKSHLFVYSGESKELLWQSEELGGCLNFTYSIHINNIDNDEALEIVCVNYDYWGQDNGNIIIIDGNDYSQVILNEYLYRCLTLGDFDSDNLIDIVAGTEYGEIVVINSLTLETKYIMNTDSSRINAIDLIEYNQPESPAILYSKNSKLNLLDTQDQQLIWQSDTIHSSLGYHNAILCKNMDTDNMLEVLIGSDHSIFQYELSIDTSQIQSYPWENNSSVYALSNNVKHHTYNFPNPCFDKTKIYIDGEKGAKIEIRVYNILGEIILVKSLEGNQGINHFEIETNAFETGTYYYQLLKNGEVLSGNKLVKL